MKTNLIFFLLIFPLFFGGCSEEETIMDISFNGKVKSSTLWQPDKLQAINRYIKHTRPRQTRSIENLILPFVVEGDTVMYIVNYEEGWDVFSNDLRLPMFLMGSETGSFYPTVMSDNSPFENFFQMTAQRLRMLKRQDLSDVDRIHHDWQTFGMIDLEVL